ncbi:serine/threonine-protein kinase RsbW [Paenibacillus sp. UNCCL117]|uniref:ATP-binding protein n=1 Tax=unclassified Paenibacillus TaxID=185978 RepID=UPI0008831B16|nr:MULTISPECIES: ATP-binding protein [unclassified Paenibacillus]SDE07935.1 serine/threonine-protein kinase RsbW [Paenibacillus sp. cl123]SFW59066.1 serine/threonine-protein kinase RsbW [Paenibacillus sp. UNCCL117]
MSGQETVAREVVLTVPADMGELDTIRLTLYGVAVRMGFTYEAIEDMKVALTEACNHALLQLAAVEPAMALRFVFSMRPGELTMRVEGQNCKLSFGEVGRSPVDMVQQAQEEDRQLFEMDHLGLYMMQALVDEVRVIPAGEDAQAAQSIELLKRLS